MSSAPLRRRSANAAFTLLEAMLLLVIVAIVGVAVGVGTQGLVKGPQVRDQEAVLSTEIVSELEQYRAMPFATLKAQSNIADAVTLKVAGQNKSFPRTVTFQQIDPTASGQTPPGDFLQVQVTIGDRTAMLWVTQQ